jgi:hypothetical protein
MPEHDTFDLDAAFRGLEQDLAGLSTPRGASVAITTARRRRRTTIGGAVVGVALVVGAVTVSANIRGHDDAVVPVDHLPAPAPFDGPHLSAATAGWTPTWGPLTEAARHKISQSFGGYCLANLRGGDRSAISALANSHVDVALAVMSDYGSRSGEARSSWRSVERQLGLCRNAQLVSSFTIPSGGEGHTYRIDPSGSEKTPEYAWIVTTGRQIGELKIFGQSKPLPAANDPMVARTFLAAIQDPASYRTHHDGSGNASPRMDEGDFTRALGSWQSGWHPSAGDAPPALTSPCYTGRWQHGSWTSKHEGLGGNGRQDVALFHTAAEARAAATSLVNALQECRNAHYGVTQTSDGAHSLLVVASGPSIVWVAQHDDAVGVVRVPSGGAAPPRSVTVAVGGLMSAWITAFAGS